jgi:hypothetical protein
MKNNKQGFLDNISAKLIFGFFLFNSGCINNDNLLNEKTIELNQPYAEWTLNNEDITVNPYDLVAHAIFTHEEGETLRSFMFYDGNHSWKFRFTGTKTGKWTIETKGPGQLGGKKGAVIVEDNLVNLPGFVKAEGRELMWSGSKKDMVPQFLMISKPLSYWSGGNVNSSKIGQTVEEFIKETGFTGLHISGIAGMWFNIDRYDTVNEDKEPLGSQDPDPRTFLVLEELLKHSYANEALIHIWLWGSDAYKVGWSDGYSGPDGIGGPMSTADQRLNRYIAARLGPIPGWSMGYGYDLHVWTDEDKLQSWYDFLKMHLGGWPHLIGARADIYDAGNPRLMQSDSLGLPRAPMSEIFWEGDYSGHYDYRVPYKWYSENIDHKNKPQFQEDRFRIREHVVFQNKDYTPEMTVRGLWHSTMAGGVANIWGNLLPPQTFQESNPYDNQAEGKIQGSLFTVDIKEEIKTYHEFWFGKERFSYDLIRDNELSDNQSGEGHLYPGGGGYINVCLRSGKQDFYVFYIENSDKLKMDLRNMNGRHNAFAVDTRKPYKEISLQRLNPELYTSIELPYISNWAIVVGG